MKRALLLMAAGIVAGWSLPSPTVAQSEGLKVHGHWVIEVRNADGTLQDRREFENALTENGQVSLVAFLGGEATVGFWVVNVYSSNSFGPCSSQSAGCHMWDVNSLVTPSAIVFKTLAVTPLYTTLTLHGTFVASLDSDVARVETAVLPRGQFTVKHIPTPIPVLANQTVAVTVTITFS